jgi:hypothetical protein
VYMESDQVAIALSTSVKDEEMSCLVFGDAEREA